MGNVINYLIKGAQFTNKKQQVESILKEEEEKGKIVFTAFDVDSDDIEDSVGEFIIVMKRKEMNSLKELLVTWVMLLII